MKKYIGEFSLNEFLNNSINKLGHIEMIFIDLFALSDSKEELIEIVSVFSKYQNVKLGFYMEEVNQEVVNNLIALNTFNIVSKTEVTELKEELKMVFTVGMSEQYIKEKFDLGLMVEPKQIYNFKEKQVVVSVTGALHRIGTTTVAISFAMYLSSLGANVCYVEANKSEHLELIAEHYKMKSKNQSFSYKGIQLQRVDVNNNEVFDVIVYDVGVLKEKILEGIKYSDISILVAGDKATEIREFRKAKEQLKDQKYNTVINFSKDKDISDINEKSDLSSIGDENIWYINQEVDIFLFEKNVDIYNKIIEKYFRETKKI